MAYLADSHTRQTYTLAADRPQPDNPLVVPWLAFPLLSCTFAIYEWIRFASLSDTVSAAIIAALASCFTAGTTIINTMLLTRHDRHVAQRMDERRLVVVQGTKEDPDALYMAGEERRALEDRRGPSSEPPKPPAERRRSDRRERPRPPSG